jgi:hypothetical protein
MQLTWTQNIQLYTVQGKQRLLLLFYYYIHKRIEGGEEGGTNSSYGHWQCQGINKYITQLAIKAQMITKPVILMEPMV